MYMGEGEEWEKEREGESGQAGLWLFFLTLDEPLQTFDLCFVVCISYFLFDSHLIHNPLA